MRIYRIGDKIGDVLGRDRRASGPGVLKRSASLIPSQALRVLFFAAIVLSYSLPVPLAAEESAAEESAPIVPSPFSTGERLLYGVQWDPPWYLFFLPAMEAGEIEVRLEGEIQHNDKKALKIVFKANSSGRLAKLAGMEVEDVFTFVAEPETFCSLKVSKHIREGKRKRQIDVEYLRDSHRLHIREMDESVVPSKLKKDEIKDNIPSCVLDPLSATYVLRMSPLQINHVQDFVIGYDDRIKEVESRVEKLERVKTPAGEFPAWQIHTTALLGGLFKEGGQFKIWLSADKRKIPLQFEIKVRLGKVMGKLKRYEPPTTADGR